MGLATPVLPLPSPSPHLFLAASSRLVELPSRLFHTALLFISSEMFMSLSASGIFMTFPLAMETSMEVLV